MTVPSNEPEGIRIQENLNGITPRHLEGFFVGWPSPPSPEAHLRLLAGSDHVILAIDDAADRVVAFITAIDDGVLTGFIPLLEVLPGWEHRGIGSTLVRQMLTRLAHLPNVDLLCDPELVGFYQQFGMNAGTGMMMRRRMPRL
ncbi:MAG: GNAT family N-acetyltransferase [Thermomicrobiales bacterium]